MPFVASGSSIINARHCVLSGKVPISKGGLIFSPSQVYFEGMGPPSVKASLVTVNCVIVCVAITLILRKLAKKACHGGVYDEVNCVPTFLISAATP